MTKRHPNYPKYLPIIKWQKWEQKALSEIGAIKSEFTPCLEVRDSSQHINLMRSFSDVWGAEALVDYANPHGNLTTTRRTELCEFLTSPASRAHTIIPVVNPLDAASLNCPNLLASIRQVREVAFRLRIEGIDISVGRIKQVADALTELNGVCEVTRLIVDGNRTPKAWDRTDLKKLILSIQSMKALGFNDVHYASGSYPPSLAGIIGEASFPRLDWALWQQMKHDAPDLHLGYSDYGTVQPEWTEEILKKYARSVAIRYTIKDSWLIVRGNSKTKQESIAISTLFTKLFGTDFKGDAYSYGDWLIAHRADPNVPEKHKNCGHYHITEAWAHHIAFVVKDQY